MIVEGHQHRRRLIETLNLPLNAHLYVVGHPLYALHSDFDAALAGLLLQDRLGYVVIVDSMSSDRPSWQQLFTVRLVGKFSNDVRARILFITPTDRPDYVGLLMAGHVLLDPFPVSGQLSPSLQALAVGVPVLTKPGDYLGGRLTLALYEMMGLEKERKGVERMGLKNETGGASANKNPEPSLVVATVGEYIATAMSLAHKPSLRDKKSMSILSKRHLLFRDEDRDREHVKHWLDFFVAASS
jgi:hypothetical protein